MRTWRIGVPFRFEATGLRIHIIYVAMSFGRSGSGLDPEPWRLPGGSVTPTGRKDTERWPGIKSRFTSTVSIASQFADIRQTT